MKNEEGVIREGKSTIKKDKDTTQEQGRRKIEVRGKQRRREKMGQQAVRKIRESTKQKAGKKSKRTRERKQNEGKER